MDHGTHSMTGADLDREIQAALTVEPSPQFVARVRTEVANQPVAPRVPWGWAAAATCAFVVVIVITGGLKQEVAPPKPSTTNEGATRERRTNERATNERATNEATADHRAEVVPTFRSAGASTAPLKEPTMPEVIIAPEDVQAFQQLIISAHERRFEASFDERPPSTPWEMTELTVPPPIIIAPLEPPAANN